MQLMSGLIARSCDVCGAGGSFAGDITHKTCLVCGAVENFQQCPNCKKVVCLPVSLLDPKVKAIQCGTCAKNAPKRRWGPGALAAYVQTETSLNTASTFLYAGLGLTPAQATADVTRRRISGVLISAPSLNGLATGPCTLWFHPLGATLVVGEKAAVPLVLHQHMRTLSISGKGPVVQSSGGGWVGGGFGVGGMLEGALLASAMNAFTTTQKIVIDTRITFSWKMQFIMMQHSRFSPQALAALLGPTLARVQVAQTSAGVGKSAPETLADIYTTALSFLRTAGSLTAEECDAAEAIVLRDNSKA